MSAGEIRQPDLPAAERGESTSGDYVTMTIAGQTFGIPVLTVRDVLAAQRITPVPLAPPEIAGSLNLRGRIVTAVDMRRRLGVTAQNPAEHGMSIVVECDGEFYSLIVDEVGDVLSVPQTAYEPNPVTLAPSWRDVCAGLYRLDRQLLVILDVERLIGSLARKAA
jgi:purine-binding chemotaxis protein CheW